MQIPSPEYITDLVPGAVFTLPPEAPQATLLIVGEIPSLLEGYQPLLQGELALRYAIPFMAPLPDAIVPGLFVAEKGGMLTGREAWDFMQSKFQMHPRADVIGLRINGAQDQVMLRELDFGLSIKVFVYSPPESNVPVATLTGLFLGNNAPELPDLLLKYLPVADDLKPLINSESNNL